MHNENEDMNDIVNAAKKLGWNITEYEDGTLNFQQFSPAGEDFSFDVNKECAVQEIYKFYEDFDIDEHILKWAEAKLAGVAGIPSLRRLVIDAENIDDMLEKLACAVSNV